MLGHGRLHEAVSRSYGDLTSCNTGSLTFPRLCAFGQVRRCSRVLTGALQSSILHQSSGFHGRVGCCQAVFDCAICGLGERLASRIPVALFGHGLPSDSDELKTGRCNASYLWYEYEVPANLITNNLKFNTRFCHHKNDKSSILTSATKPPTTEAHKITIINTLASHTLGLGFPKRLGALFETPVFASPAI